MKSFVYFGPTDRLVMERGEACVEVRHESFEGEEWRAGRAPIFIPHGSVGDVCAKLSLEYDAHLAKTGGARKV